MQQPSDYSGRRVGYALKLFQVDGLFVHATAQLSTCRGEFALGVPTSTRRERRQRRPLPACCWRPRQRRRRGQWRRRRHSRWRRRARRARRAHRARRARLRHLERVAWRRGCAHAWSALPRRLTWLQDTSCHPADAHVPDNLHDENRLHSALAQRAWSRWAERGQRPRRARRRRSRPVRAVAADSDTSTVPVQYRYVLQL